MSKKKTRNIKMLRLGYSKQLKRKNRERRLKIRTHTLETEYELFVFYEKPLFHLYQKALRLSLGVDFQWFLLSHHK